MPRYKRQLTLTHATLLAIEEFSIGAESGNKEGNDMARQDRTPGPHPTNLKDLVAAKSEWSRRLLPPPTPYQEGPIMAALALSRAVSPVPTENVVGVGVGERSAMGNTQASGQLSFLSG